jgi:peptidoglycan/LPS O-acetylase OafA/YrhL
MSLACVLLVGWGGLDRHFTTFLQTATYVYFFVIGILIAIHVDRIRSSLSSLPRGALACLWLVALFGLTAAPPDTSHVAEIGDGMLLILSGLSAGLIIALCIIGGRAERLLMAPVPRFFGRISYSLYLTHAIVILAVIHAAGGAWSLPVSFAIALPLAFIVAHLSQRYVEAPSQLFGKMLADRIDHPENAVLASRPSASMSAQPRLESEFEA